MISIRITVHTHTRICIIYVCVVSIYQECGRNKTKECKPSHTSYRTYHLYNGTITKEIIKECTCQGVPSNNNCKRRKRFTTYFEGSSFEQKIDTGECVGVFQAAKGKQLAKL